MIQLAEEEVMNGRKVSVRAMDYASRAGKVVSNFANTLTNVISKASEDDKEMSTKELVKFITDDPVFWKEFRKAVADENVVTSMGTQECLAKFLTERMDEIKKAYIVHIASKSPSEKEASMDEGRNRRRFSAFSSRQIMTPKENTTMTSSRSEFSLFRNRNSSQLINPQKNTTWPTSNDQSVKHKAITGEGKKTSASTLLRTKLSLSPIENITITLTNSELNQSNNVKINEKKNSTWSELDIYPCPRHFTGKETAATPLLPSAAALKLSSSFNNLKFVLGHERFKAMESILIETNDE